MLRVHLIYGLTRDLDLVRVDEIEAYAKRLPNFTCSTIVAEEATDHPRKGWVTQHVPAGELNEGNMDVYAIACIR